MTQPILATYRIQFRPEFTLYDAAAIVPYLSALGVSHLYASPVLQATPGSTHGYDQIDPTQINVSLGSGAGLNVLSETLTSRGMGLVLDIVPNHMAIHPLNPWWWDVLRNGPASRFAGYFDVDWNQGGNGSGMRGANAILIPILGDHYGRVLEAGAVQVVFDGDNFIVQYFDNTYPVDSGTLGSILGMAAERGPNAELAFLAGAFDRLPDSGAGGAKNARRRYRDAEVLRGMLARLVRENPAVGEDIQAVLAEVNSSPDQLDAFLSRQNYRLALWKISATELGYRRFFDINTLIGLCMEDEEVYRDTHALVMNLVERGVVDGLRIDHPDGLRDPRQYFERLRADATQRGAPNLWIGIEKILEPGEELPQSWPVQGTTGYDFLNRASGLFVDPRAEAALTRFYQEFSGLEVDYETLVHEKKLLAATELLGSDLERLTELFLQICERHRNYRDYTRREVRQAIAEMAAALPVYRTYEGQRGLGIKRLEIREEEEADNSSLISQSPNPLISNSDPRLTEFIAEVLARKISGDIEADFAARFEQYTGPVMAKGVEDTTFYIYNRFVSRNEVGGDPGHFGVSVEAFHQANLEAQTKWPLTMLASTTHDTKRSEDVRARLNVLSEMPGEWTAAVQRWAEINAGQRQGELPDRNAEYLLYQTLVGAWPIDAERAVAYMIKAAREAKTYTTWTAPDEAYEAALERFVRGILADARFTADLETFVAEVLTAGRINGLAQTLLKLTSPGIPDFYQGAELWDYSLVDPDNRRAVDYTRRQKLLALLNDDTRPEAVLAQMDAGLPKLWIIRQGLALRRAHPEWFGADSSYVPLRVARTTRAGVEQAAGEIEEAEEERQRAGGGRKASVEEEVRETELVPVTGAEAGDPAVAYRRGESVLAAAPRLSRVFREEWGNYTLSLPPGTWRNLLTHERIQGGGAVTLAQLWKDFPAALLVKEG